MSKTFTEDQVKDMILLAENRGGEMMLRALGEQVRVAKDEIDSLYIGAERLDKYLLHTAFEKALGRR